MDSEVASEVRGILTELLFHKDSLASETYQKLRRIKDILSPRTDRVSHTRVHVGKFLRKGLGRGGGGVEVGGRERGEGGKVGEWSHKGAQRRKDDGTFFFFFFACEGKCEMEVLDFVVGACSSW